MSRYQYLPLTPQEAYLLSRIDGVLDVESLLKIGGGSRGGTAKTLYALLSCGIVEVRKEGHAPGQPTGLEALNVEVSAQDETDRAPGHSELVKNTYRRIDWLTHYELLGVPQTATPSEISLAYFERSRLFHPDLRHRGDLAQFEKELTAVFERLKIANEVLSDPRRRAEYDANLAEAPVPLAVAETTSDPKVRQQLAQRSFQRARHLIGEKDYHPAVEMLREAIRFVPNNPEYRFALGQVELKNVHWLDKGLENLKEAARLEPRNLSYIREAARALYEHGRTQQAELFARRALALSASSEDQALLDAILSNAPPLAAPEPSAPVSADQVELTPTAPEAPAPASPEPRAGLLARLFRRS